MPYAPVNGLRMYYEIHGDGPAAGAAARRLHDDRDVRAARCRAGRAPAGDRPELQAHGRTADIDRPLTYEQMADDTAALIRHLGIGQADVFGYSMGGGAALQVAIRHPELVRKLIVVSAGYRYDGSPPR